MADGSSIQPLSLNHDNLESHSERKQSTGQSSFSSINSHDFVNYNRGSKPLDGHYGLSEQSRPLSDENEDMHQYIANPDKQHEEDSLFVHSRERSNSEDAESALYGHNKQSRPTEVVGYSGPDDNYANNNDDTTILHDANDSFNLEIFGKLSERSQLTVLKNLDARRNKSQIIQLAEHYLVDLTDDDNKPRKLKDVKKEIIERWSEYH